jgi:DHA1 family multidrug resistance protein-like MFS transporter
MSADLILVAFSLFTWGIGEGIFFYFQPIYLQELGADPLQIGAVLGGVGAMMMIAHIPAGYLADRVGRRQMMWLAWVLGAAATWLMALGSSLPVFTAGLLIYGLTGFVTVPMNSYITAARGKWTVGRAIMIISAVYNLGMVVGPLLGGFVGERYGLRHIFLISAIVFIISTLVILFIRPQPLEIQPKDEKRNGFLFNPRYLTYLGAVFLAVFATYLPQPLSQNFLTNERGLSLVAIGGLTSLTGLGVATLNLGLGYLDARLGFLIAQAAVGMFALLLWKGSSVPWYGLGYFLMGGYKTTRSLAVAQTRTLVHAANMGLAYGVTETIGAIATIAAPLFAGYLYTFNPTWVYSVSVAVTLVSILVSARFSPSRRPSEEPVAGKTLPITE